MRRITRRLTSCRHHRQRPGQSVGTPVVAERTVFDHQKPGRIRVLNKDGSPLHTITASMPPIYVRGQAGLLDVALDQNFARNRRIFFVYIRDLDPENCGLAVDSAISMKTRARSRMSPPSFKRSPLRRRRSASRARASRSIRKTATCSSRLATAPPAIRFRCRHRAARPTSAK